MTYSLARTATFTITDARYVASKMGADLRNLNARYGDPDLEVIPLYVEEAAQLLAAGYLNTVDFGYKRGDVWKLRLRYTATAGGHLRDDPPGRLPDPIDVAGLTFYSYLTHSAAFNLLDAAAKKKFEATLPIERVGTPEPRAVGGYATDLQYSRNGNGMNRNVYKAL
jgi:Bacterial HORMA domain family 1